MLRERPTRTEKTKEKSCLMSNWASNTAGGTVMTICCGYTPSYARICPVRGAALEFKRFERREDGIRGREMGFGDSRELQIHEKTHICPLSRISALFSIFPPPVQPPVHRSCLYAWTRRVLCLENELEGRMRGRRECVERGGCDVERLSSGERQPMRND